MTMRTLSLPFLQDNIDLDVFYVAQASSLSAFGLSDNAILTSLATSTDLNGNTSTNMTFVDQSTTTKWQINQSPFSIQPSIQKSTLDSTCFLLYEFGVILISDAPVFNNIIQVFVATTA